MKKYLVIRNVDFFPSASGFVWLFEVRYSFTNYLKEISRLLRCIAFSLFIDKEKISHVREVIVIL